MNVLLIMDDALRPDHMGCYGYHKNTTPNLDRLAREGVVFEKVAAVSTHTLPPVFSIITGLNTASHGLMTPEDYARHKSGSGWRGRRTPLHALRERGYLIDGELVTRWVGLGFEQDTEDMEGYFSDHRNDKWFFMAQPYPTHLPHNPPEEYYRLFVDEGFSAGPGTLKRLETVRTRMILHPPDVISAMESGRQDPIGEGDETHKRSVAVVQFSEEDRPGINALYDGEVRVFDDMVGRWVNRLEELEVLEDTLILVTSDHGEELLERGHVGHTSCNLKGTLYDECLLVPLVMFCPSRLPRGRVVREQVSQIDLMPTIFEVLRVDMDCETDGMSARPLLLDQAGAFRREAYAETTPAGWQALEGDDRKIWCVRTNEWKLILNTSPLRNARICHSERYRPQGGREESQDVSNDGILPFGQNDKRCDFAYSANGSNTDASHSNRRYELYNLVEDPCETHNLFPMDDLNERELMNRLDRYAHSRTLPTAE